MSDIVTKETIDALLAENPGLNRIPIRIDKETQKASVIDVVRMITGKSANESAEVIRRLTANLKARCFKLKINNKGNLTVVATAPVLVEIIWELPGKAAKAFRRQSAHMICRILGGDMTLAAEIEKKYRNTSEETKQFMMAHVEKPLTVAEVEKQQLELMEMRFRVMSKGIDVFERLGGCDDRDKIFFKDIMRAGYKRKRADDSHENREISIPLICAELGLRANGKESTIGKKLASLWRLKYSKLRSESPPKRETYFRGKPYQENCYYQNDHDIMEQAIRSVQ
jgi:hypothetical protein